MPHVFRCAVHFHPRQQHAEARHILRVVFQHIRQQVKISRLEVVEEALRHLRARQIIKARNAQHRFFQLAQIAPLQAQFEHPPRNVQ